MNRELVLTIDVFAFLWNWSAIGLYRALRKKQKASEAIE